MADQKIILDLCGGTGSWSRPWQFNGYDVRIITLQAYDVLTYDPPDNVWGILAAPPSSSNYDCVHDWEETTGGSTTEGCYVNLVCRKCGKQKQIFTPL